MIARCHNQNHASYSRYGGRGIVVCDRWREDFANFYQDMGSRPSRKHASHNTSGFKGVSFYRQTGRWQAYIRHGGRRLHLGMFATAEDAAAAYDAAAIRLKGEFARTNAMIQAEAA
jgi:hypothetical protein